MTHPRTAPLSVCRYFTRSSLVLLLLTQVQTAWADFSTLADPSLRTCVTQLARKHQWSAPAEVTSIKCHNAKIKSLEGIASFTQLTSLSLYKNQLEEAHIPPLPHLTHLNLSGNQLSTLHLSDLPALTGCFVFKNKLHSLVLEGVPKLQKLKANNNQLTSLRFKNSPLLSKLYIFDNELETLDMDTLPTLSYFDARHNPMPDDFYDYLDTLNSVTVLHDGNAEDWQ